MCWLQSWGQSLSLSLSLSPHLVPAYLSRHPWTQWDCRVTCSRSGTLRVDWLVALEPDRPARGGAMATTDAILRWQPPSGHFGPSLFA